MWSKPLLLDRIQILRLFKLMMEVLLSPFTTTSSSTFDTYLYRTDSTGNFLGFGYGDSTSSQQICD